MKIIIEALFYGENAGMAKHLRELLLKWVNNSSVNLVVYVPSNKLKYFSLPSNDNINLRGVRLVQYSPLLGIMWKLFILSVITRLSGAEKLFLPFNAFVPTKKWYGVETLVVIRDLAECVIKDKYDPLRIFYRTKVMLPLTLTNASKIIFISKSTFRDAVQYMGYKKTNYRIIYHGRSIEFVPGLPQDCYIKGETLKNHKYFLTVGRIDPIGKNLIKPLLAFEKFANSRAHEDIKYVFSGADWRNSNIFYEYLSKYKFKDRVLVLGYVSIKELIDLYSNAIACVFPSFYEGFGHPLIESMSCGCPVACSNTSSFIEIASNAAMFFDPKNENDILLSMNEVFANERKRNEMIKNGFVNIERYSWKITAKKTLNYLLES